MQGELSKTITASIEKLTEAVAGLEASLDYLKNLKKIQDQISFTHKEVKRLRKNIC